MHEDDENKPFKQVVNEVLRRGLIDRTVSRDTEQQNATPTLKVGRPRYANLDNVSEVLAVAEREDYA